MLMFNLKCNFSFGRTLHLHGISWKTLTLISQTMLEQLILDSGTESTSLAVARENVQSFANISQCLAYSSRWIFQTVSSHCSSRPFFASLGESRGAAILPKAWAKAHIFFCLLLKVRLEAHPIRPKVWAKTHFTDQRSKWNLVFSSKPHEAQIYVLR